MKTIKKYLSMAALALVGAVMASCSSDDNFANDNKQQPANSGNVVTLTTTIGLDGGTRALAADGKKTFAVGEQVALAYWNTSISQWDKAVSQALTDDDISADGKTATLTFTLNNPQENTLVQYCYPAAMANVYGQADLTKLATQTGGTLASLAANYDLATGDGNLDGLKLPAVTLINQLAILAITLKNSDGSSDITSSITGLTVGDGTNTYAVTRETGAGPVYVAIQPTTSATITVNATDGSKNYTKTLTNKTYAASNGYNVSWRMAEAVKPDLLSGVFSVSDSKTVKFSKGNLRYASGTWSFFDNQYDYYTSYSADAWDKFGWSTSATTYGMSTSTKPDDYSGSFVDWGSNSDLQTALGTGWFTLSSAEWTYLFGTDSSNKRTTTSGLYYAKAKVNNVQGIILFPDTYTHPGGVTAPTNVNSKSSAYTSNTYSSADWTKMESAGCVFLPAAGHREGSTVNFPGTYGYYWSATPYSTNSVYRVYFTSSTLNPASWFSRCNGYSVRLVREVTE